MKKIGVLTLYYNNCNCGGQLQAYALCRKLNDLGYDAEQIRFDFYTFPFDQENTAQKIKRIIRNNLGVKKTINRIISEYRFARINRRNMKFVPTIKADRIKSYYSFSENIVPHSDVIYNKENLADCKEVYDAFVVGSDQVWRSPTESSVFLLNFLPPEILKISYAASVCLTRLNTAQKNALSKSLKSFKAVSVREKEAVYQLTPLCSQNVEWVLDPTLLLSREQWDEICPERMINEKYVFCYFLGEDKNERKIAAQFAKERNLKLVTFIHSTNNYMPCDAVFGDEQIYDISPERFLSLIKYAEYVFTDSFHASVFSYLYHKEFFVFVRKNNKGMDSRIYSLLELIECQDHFCNTKKKVNSRYVNDLQPIDYAKSRDKLKEQLDFSINYLKYNLG